MSDFIKTAQFTISNTDYRKCPQDDKAEFAFIGRSNVGKSSLINMLTNHSKLAKTSSRPGKTQLINHFLINDDWYLVDLPGYGYAKVSKKQQASWMPMIEGYLQNRNNLICVFVLIDSRHEPQRNDLEFIDFIGRNELPLALIFTKADKQSINKAEQTVSKYRKVLKGQWDEFPPYFITSAENKFGREKVLEFITELNEAWKAQ